MDAVPPSLYRSVSSYGPISQLLCFPISTLCLCSSLHFVHQIYEGTSQIQRVVISREIIARTKAGSLDAPK